MMLGDGCWVMDPRESLNQRPLSAPGQWLEAQSDALQHIAWDVGIASLHLGSKGGKTMALMDDKRFLTWEVVLKWLMDDCSEKRPPYTSTISIPKDVRSQEIMQSGLGTVVMLAFQSAELAAFSSSSLAPPAHQPLRLDQRCDMARLHLTQSI